MVIERGEGRKVVECKGYYVQTLIKIDVDENGVKTLGCIDEECPK